MANSRRDVAAAVAAGLAGAARAQEAVHNDKANAVYIAHLSALNTTVTGRSAAGEASFTIKGDSLTIAVDARGLPEDITHWQLFHGFTDGRQSTCPARSADANGDGIIDVTETGPMAGTTMVPFSSDPVGMDVPGGSYPNASARGRLQYRQTVSRSARRFHSQRPCGYQVFPIRGLTRAYSGTCHVADRVRHDQAREVGELAA